MALSLPPSSGLLSRRSFIKTGLFSAAGLALYSGEIERHWIEVVRRDFFLGNLPETFDGMRIVQISDIHLDVFTEPFFLHHAVRLVNGLKPDAIFLTGDFVTASSHSRFGPEPEIIRLARAAAWQCARILADFECKALYAVLGNHDCGAGQEEVSAALESSGITVLRNACLPIERAGGRFWLAGLEDPLNGHPNADLAVPQSIRNIPNEPVLLMCHGPDYADHILPHPAGQAVDLMLSGHTHGGQVRLPLFGALSLPPMGRKYIEGWFRLGRMQLYVNRGLGTVGVPFRFDCPPEITVLTLRKG